MTDEVVGVRLRRLRLAAGLSQRDLARRAAEHLPHGRRDGVSFAYVSRLESGARTASVTVLRALAAALDVDAGYLETGEDGVSVRVSGDAVDEAAFRWGVGLRLADLTADERRALEAAAERHVEANLGGMLLKIRVAREVARETDDEGGGA